MTIAHGLLRLFGFRVSNLIYFNKLQLDRLMNKQSFSIIPLKSKNLEKMQLEYVEEMEPILMQLRPSYEFILKNWNKILEKNKKKEIKKPYVDTIIPKAEISEFWHTCYLSREKLTKSINEDLKKAGVILNKRITSHSYRRGFARLLTKKCGLKIAKEFLQHRDITTTQKYVDQRLSSNEIKQALRDVLKVKNYDVEVSTQKNFDDKFYSQSEKGYKRNFFDNSINNSEVEF